MMQVSRTHDVIGDSPTELMNFDGLDWRFDNHKSDKTDDKLRLDCVRALVVDDLPDNLLLVRHFLQIAGATVDIARNGQEAIECCTRTAYDIIIMDISMPVMDGAEATRRIRQQGNNIPIIALTAYALKEDRERYMTAGFNEYLCKPVDKKLLIRCVSEFTKSQA